MATLRHLVLGLAVGIQFCGQLVADEQDWFAKLSSGYERGDQTPLLELLAVWRLDSKPVSPDLLGKKPRVERAVYDLYRDYYRPYDADEESPYYSSSDFVVIQNSVEVSVVESNLDGVFDLKNDYTMSKFNALPRISTLVIKDFRPDVTFKGKKVLYLDDGVNELVGLLLSDNGGTSKAQSYWEEECESEGRLKRLEYLNKAVKILPGHWGRGWHFETQPYIESIVFSSDLNRAIVSYRVYYGGGKVSLSRTGDGWKVSSEGAWWES